MNKELTIGLFGFGCVGQGLYDVLQNSVLFKSTIKKIGIKNPHKKRSLQANIFTTNKWEILHDPAIDTIVELIDDVEEAYDIVTYALSHGKNVVTANKKLVAEHLDEFIKLQQQYGTSLLYEASCCGGIPVIRTLEEYYDNEPLKELSGIFNGSSNFILTKVFKERNSYSSALKEAQELGFAETNPILDVGGYDPKYKLIILTLHAFGVILKPEQVLNYGIQHLSDIEIKIYNSTGLNVKLSPQAKLEPNGSLSAFVIPKFINTKHPLYHVNFEFNAVHVNGFFSDGQLFTGKGAGGHPTGSAVLSDISALSYRYSYEYKKHQTGVEYELNNRIEKDIYFNLSETLWNFLFPGKVGYEINNRITGIIRVSIEWLIRNTETLNNDRAFIAEVLDEDKNQLLQILEETSLENYVLT